MPGENVLGDARHFIYSKWLRSLRYENDFFRLIWAEAYWPAYQAHIRKILDGPETTVRLAVLSDEPDVILGFSVSRRTVLDYVYVHKDQRRQGIASQLVPQGIEWITHVTKTALTIWGSHERAKEWRFDPFR
jgi:GNAT superfamily N-acetyltransferase